MRLRDWFSRHDGAAALAVAALIAVTFGQMAGYSKWASTDAARIARERPAQDDPSRDQWRAERDLEAQNSMAFWTMLAAIAAGAGVLLTGMGVLYVAWTLELNRKLLEKSEEANAIARAMGEAQVRAYLTVQNVLVDFVDHLPSVRFQLSNAGNSPAFKVAVSCSCKRDWEGDVERKVRGHGASAVGTLRSGASVDLSVWTGQPIEDVKISPPAAMMMLLVVIRLKYEDVFANAQSFRLEYMGVVGCPHRGKQGIPMSEHVSMLATADFLHMTDGEL